MPLHPLQAHAQEIHIAALGDSLTQGYGLSPQDGFVSQLQVWITAHDENIHLINAGVSGDTTAGGLSRIEWTLTPEIDGLIVALGGNDVLRGIDPAESRRNLDGILSIAKARDIPVLLVGIDAPLNFGVDYKQDFDAIYPDLAQEYGTLYFDSFVGPLHDIGDIKQVLKTHMQSDAIHPNAKGVAVIVEAIGPTIIQLAGQTQGQ